MYWQLAHSKDFGVYPLDASLDSLSEWRKDIGSLCRSRFLKPIIFSNLPNVS